MRASGRGRIIRRDVKPLSKALILLLFAAVGTATPAIALDRSARPVLRTPHFAFYSDVRVNTHDALVAAARARLLRQAAPFSAAEQSCLEHLPAAAREGWTRAVDDYATATPTATQRFYTATIAAGMLRPDSVTDPADRQFLKPWSVFLSEAVPAYQQCRWPAQDALNRAWIDHVKTLLATYENTLGERLPALFGTPWASLPIRVDVLNGALVPTGANTAGVGDPPAGHILVSSTNPSNQGLAALEVVFHEASHLLSQPGSPLSAALQKATAGTGATMPPDIVHEVHFFMTGETVRRTFAERGVTYTPLLFSLKLFTDRFRDVISGAWSPQVDGTRTVEEAAGDLVRVMNASQ